MKLVIPMAGRGKRFLDAGEKRPKMLIPVSNKLMIEWALEGLKFIPKEDWIFVILQEHVEKWRLDEVLLDHFGNVMIEALPDVTEGQACTVAAARKHYSSNDPLVIHNTDTYFSSSTIEDNLGLLGTEVDGVIGVFQSDCPSYSFVQLNEENYVTKVVEKEAISQWATTGLYAFGKAGDFLDAVEDSMKNKKKVRGEYFVGPLYNHLIENDARIIIDKCSEIYDFGKPEKLKDFEKAI